MKSLQIFCGVNVRKTTALLAANIRAAAERLIRAHSSEKVLLIVPDQYTMTAERAYLEALGEKRMNAVRVLSFKRLAASVTARDTDGKRILGASGKSALLLQAYANVEKDLRYYKNCGSFHFAEALSEVVSDMKINRLSSDELRRSEKDKLCDLADIFDEYNRLLTETFIDPDDRLSIFAQAVRSGDSFSSVPVFVDFFKVLNASEIGALTAMVEAGADVSVTLKTDQCFADEEVFAPVNRVMKKLLSRAASFGADCTVRYDTDGRLYSDNPTMCHLEKNLFCASVIPLAGTAGNVLTYAAAGRSDEAEMIAAEIASLVRDHGYRYGDFAVVTRKPETYEAIFDTVFGEYDIPVFQHRKTPLRKKLPVRFLTCLLDAVTEANVADSFCELVKTGLCGITAEDASAFEEYVRVWNLKYLSQFKKPFERSLKGFDLEFETEEDRAAVVCAERVRETLIRLIEPFSEKNLSAVSFCTRAYALFEACGMSERLKQLGNLYETYGESSLYAENMQVYQLMLDTLDEIAATGGENVLTASDFRNLLLAAADSAMIGILPTSADAVLIGAADVVPLFSQKIVFVCGLAEGEFPLVGADGGLIDSFDRKLICEKSAKADSGLTAEDRYLYELFFTRFVLTTATDRVVLSYPSVTDGECTPSQAFTQTENCFGNTAHIPVPTLDDATSFASRIQREKPSFATYTGTGLDELDRYFRDSEYSRYLQEPVLCDELTPATAEALFGKKMSVSYSRVDSYYRCRYHYFFEYGLKLHRNREVRFDPCNTGSYIHRILETVMQVPDWYRISEEQLREIIRRETDAYFEPIFAGETPSSTFMTYLGNQIEHLVRLFVSFREDRKNCLFVPTFFEQEVGDRSVLKPVTVALDGGEIKMTGKIDRIDVYEKDGVNYLRVIDYKTGSKEFDPVNVANGLDIQLLMYLYALKENGRALLDNVHPVGAKYVSCKPNIADLVQEETEKRKKPGSAKPKTSDSGIYSDDAVVLNALGGVNGSFYYIHDAQFDVLYAYVADLMKKMGNELLKGHILRDPVEIGNRSSCQYCELKTVCPNYKKHRECRLDKSDAALAEMIGGGDVQ